MHDTLAEAKAELIALFGPATAPTFTGVKIIFDHLPPRSKVTDTPAVAVYTDAITPTTWNIGVALIVNTTDDAKLAQDTIDTLLPAIDELTNTGVFGPAAWTITYPSEGSHYVATSVYQVGRGDI